MTEQRSPYNEDKSITLDQLKFLKGLGLEITPHSDPTYGWGFKWYDRPWDGPYPTPFDAVQEAFEDVGRAMRVRSDAPFPSHDGYMVRWNEQQQDWDTVKFEDGKIWRFTGSGPNEGWQVLLSEEHERRPLLELAQYLHRLYCAVHDRMRPVEAWAMTEVASLWEDLGTERQDFFLLLAKEVRGEK